MLVADLTFRGRTFKVAYEPDNHSTLFTYEDEESVRERWWHIQEDDVVFDIGAAHGSYAITALALGASMVYAWAPEGSDKFLRLSLKANLWGPERCKVYTDGLWSAPGHVQVYEGNQMPTYYPQGSTDVPPAAFPVETLDNIVKREKPSRIDWIKIDVEGCEVEVIRGALSAIERFRPKILIENHAFKNPQIQVACHAILTGMGYREDGPIPHHSVSHSLYSI